ncbi:hypothetical protein KY386_02550 [Candidatus Parcubacteria bacterium]|nr:hypothetical protein [Candidatus Parcubacteria bacterium]
MNRLTWSSIGGGPYLYQKEPEFDSLESFLQNSPENKVIGTYDYDPAALTQNVRLPDYRPALKETVIDTPLRGRTVMYVYLDNEPFKMKLTKRDLNWYADPDVMNIKVYKQQDVVLEATIDDDGNDTDNRRVGLPQEVELANPGPGLPEAGVYKIVIDAPGDTALTRLETNLHKIVFEGPIYPVANKEVYGGLVEQTKPTNLVTDAPAVSFVTYHQALQDVTVGGQMVNINQPQQAVKAANPGGQAAVTIPKSDVVVNGIGYFAFTPEQFFTPTPYKILPIRDAKDLEQVDYVLTNYQKPRQEGEWLVAEREFDLSDAVIQKGKLSWLISAPGLKENNRTIEIKSIEMTLTKKGWWGR